MPYIIGFGGEPATGKSTIMKTAMAKTATDWSTDTLRTYGAAIKVMVSTQKQITVLGHYIKGETYGGTDTMSMSIQPSVTKMLTVGIKNPSWGYWFEGDRLFNSKFIHFLREELRWPAFFFIINAEANTIDSRHASRDNQNATWLLGRKTKVANLIKEFNLVSFSNNNIHDLIHCADLVCDLDKTLRLQSERQFYA
jgi:hypothetical protein